MINSILWSAQMSLTEKRTTNEFIKLLQFRTADNIKSVCGYFFFLNKTQDLCTYSIFKMKILLEESNCYCKKLQSGIVESLMERALCAF